METFVVRVWVPGDAVEARGTLRGLVEHAQTGRRQVFAGGAELVMRIDELLECSHRVWGDSDPDFPVVKDRSPGD